MFKVELEGFEEVQKDLARMGRNMPKAAAMTLTWMAQAGKQETEKRIPRIFDRPTKWTRKSTYLKAANMTTLEAKVWVKDGSVSSLVHHIEGGPRRAKASETLLRRKGILRGSNQYIVPSMSLKLNQHGNVTKGFMNKILSSLGAQHDSRANTTKQSLKRNSSQGDFFLVTGQRGVQSGVYKRAGGKRNQRLDPVLIFVRGMRYKRRYPFHEIVEDAAYDAFPRSVDRALDRMCGI